MRWRFQICVHHNQKLAERYSKLIVFITKGSHPLLKNMPQKHSASKTNLKDHTYFVYIFPCFLAAVCFINGLQGQFVHDDLVAIQNNQDVTGQTPMSHLLRNDFWGTDMHDASSHKSYRPLCVLTFRLDYALSGGNPVWFHIINTALHVCVTLVVTFVCLRVLDTSHLHALLSSSLFAVHPIHTEAVTGLVGRADVLAALFFLLSFYTYSRSVLQSSVAGKDISEGSFSTSLLLKLLPSQILYFLASLMLATAAMLCKETGMTVLGVSLFFELLINGRRIVTELKQRQPSASTTFSLIRCICLVISGASLMVFRLWIMNFEQPQVFHEESNPAAFSPYLLTRVLTFLYLPVFNFWLLLFPAKLSYDWSGNSIQLVSSLTDHRSLYTLVFYTAVLLLASRSLSRIWKMKWREESRSSLVMAMSAGLMVVPFLPASNMLFTVGFVVAERVLYIPSLGYCLMMAHGFLAVRARLHKIKSHLLALYFVFLMVLLVRTYNRNQVWLSRHSLFWSGVHTLSHNARAHYNLANLLRDEGDRLGAEKHYRMAIDLNPKVPSYHLNLGTVLINKTQAESCYQKALRLQPYHTGALVNMGSLLLDRDDLSGITYIKQALAIDPRHLEALLAMSYALMKKGEVKEAERYISRALHVSPNSPKAHLCHAVYLHKTDQRLSALREYQTTLTLDPIDANALFSSAIIQFDMGLLKEAEKQLKTAVSLNKGCSECFTLLASVYSRQGLKQDAVITLGQASALAPNNSQINLKYVAALKENHQSSKARSVLQELQLRMSHSLSVHKFAFTFAMEEERYAEALQHIQEAITVAEQTGDSSLSSLYRDQGAAYRHNHDMINALKSYEKAIHLNPTFVEVITDAGTIHFLQKNFAQADIHYLRALSIDPNNILAKENLDKLRNVYTRTQQDNK